MENLKKQLSSKIAIPILNGFEILNVYDIVRCEANRNYCKIFFLNPNDRLNPSELLVSRILKEISEILEVNGFLRIHHSHLINPNFIKKLLKSEGGMVEMMDGTKIKITHKKEEVINEIFNSIRKI